MFFTLVAEALEATKDKRQGTKDKGQRTCSLLWWLRHSKLQKTKDTSSLFELRRTRDKGQGTKD
jgi:hypothetical protein